MSALQDPDPAIRIAAVDGLAGIGEKNAIAPLTTAVYDEDEDVRYAAFVALKRYPYPEVIPALQHGLQEKSLRFALSPSIPPFFVSSSRGHTIISITMKIVVYHLQALSL